jgi:hypothetical protein
VSRGGPNDDGGLAREVRRLADLVSAWTPARWALATPSGQRAELVHDLVQQIADLAADAEGQPHRPVPRLEHDAFLPDQLRVVSHDLVAAGASVDVLTAVTARIADVRRILIAART